MTIFKDKTAMPANANMRIAEPPMSWPIGAGEPIPVQSDAPVRTAQTLQELRDSRRADDSMAVRNIMRPRRGFDM